MDARTADRLVELNKQFYQTFAPQFSSTRRRLQPGVLQMLNMLAGDESILDLGCGNGELAHQLIRRGHRASYIGVDFSFPLLEAARLGVQDSIATFIQADLESPGWDRVITRSVPPPFDMVTAFATLHHVPSVDRRLAILGKVYALLRPGGRFIHSEWQFLNSKKLHGRIQPWSEVGLTGADVEFGDYLVDWRLGGRGLRYVHHFNESELEILADGSGFTISTSFLSDGSNGRLALYQVWERP